VLVQEGGDHEPARPGAAGGGGFIVVETSEDLVGPVHAAPPGEVVASAVQTLDAGLDTRQPALTRLLSKLRAVSPDEVTIELGIKVSTKAGIVAEAAGEANFKVTLLWRQGDPAAR
jgi:hypothetical protein